jgi:uncharacterized protein YebE (UPF0316 family)
VAKEKSILAMIFSFLTTVVGLLVFYNILTQLDRERSIMGIIVYAVGIATGTFLGVKLKLGESKSFVSKLLSILKRNI